MSRLFRSTTPGTSDYAALALFAAAYLGVMGLVLTPQPLLSTPAGSGFVQDQE